MPAIYDTRPQDAIGTTTVNKITQGRANHGWQDFSSINDNGVDGMIIMRKRQGKLNIDTGETVFVQIKCGSQNGYFKEAKKRPKHFGVNVGADYINIHRPRWQNLFGPVIMVYVDYKTEKAWWADLKDDNSYIQENKSLIIVPKSQRFGIHSFGEFKRLNGYLHINPEISKIELTRSDVSIIRPSVSLKTAAKAFYRTWADEDNTQHPDLGKIIISREGWRHLCRKGRKMERIIQSWLLLGVAKRIISEVRNVYQLRVETTTPDGSGNYSQIDYISLRAQVIFPQRHGSIIQVILKRRRTINTTGGIINSQIRFYSVYEPLSKKAIR